MNQQEDRLGRINAIIEYLHGSPQRVNKIFVQKEKDIINWLKSSAWPGKIIFRLFLPRGTNWTVSALTIRGR